MAVSPSPVPSRFFRLVVEEKSILGYKTSAAFLSSLGSNLRLDFATPQPSPASTPVLASCDGVVELSSVSQIDNRGIDVNLEISNTAAQPQPLAPRAQNSDLSLAISPRRHLRGRSSSSPTAQPRPGKYEVVTLTNTGTKSLALRMIAMNVRSQWLLAVWSLCTHPLNAIGFFLLLCLASRYVPLSNVQGSTISAHPALHWSHYWLWMLSFGLMVTGLTIGSLIFTVRNLYSPLAARINMRWLDGDRILVILNPTVYLQDDEMTADAGLDSLDQLAGVLVLSWQVREAQVSKCRRKRLSRGFIRAWAVQDSVQNQGVGTALLREAARIVATKGGEGLWFAEDHAHSTSVIPSIYSSPFDRRDHFANQLLNGVLEEEMGPVRRH